MRSILCQELSMARCWTMLNGSDARFPEVDPVRLGFPVRRHRVYVCGCQDANPQGSNFHIEASRIFESLQGPLLSLGTVDDLLLSLIHI